MDLIKKYNELIKLSIEIKSVWQKGSYSEKQKEIENCNKDIEFFKLMKKKINKKQIENN